MKNIYISKQKYSSLLNNSEFVTLITLGRMINSARFMQQAALPNSLDLQANTRQMLNSFFFLCSVIYEIDQWADKNYKKYKGYASWISGFSKIKSSKSYKSFKQRILAKVRNKFTYHFDSEYIRIAIEKYKPSSETHVICSLDKNLLGEKYFEFSDKMSLAYLFSASSDIEINSNLITMIKTINELSQAFICACEDLISEIISIHFVDYFSFENNDKEV